jgi:hypothetical protein
MADGGIWLVEPPMLVWAGMAAHCCAETECSSKCHADNLAHK